MEHDVFIHPTSDVSPRAQVGAGTRIWQQCQVREGATIGESCILGKGVYVDAHVRVGNRTKIQNGVSIYEGVVLEDGVFCGPHCVFTNDRRPRAINPDGTLQSTDDWTVTETLVRTGASIGANATIVCGVSIGRWAMVGAGAVVTRDVPAHGLVYGNPARLSGFVCSCGERLLPAEGADAASAEGRPMVCPRCGTAITIPRAVYAQVYPDR